MTTQAEERPTKAKEKQKVICTGFGEIDKRLGGGIPLGSLTLIEGQSDAGKSVFAQQLMSGSLAGGQWVTLFTTENTVKSMNSQMESLGLSITDALLLGRMKIFTIEPSGLRESSFFENILAGIRAYPKYGMVVVDSVTPVIAHTDQEAIISYFERCKRLCDGGRTIINIAHTYAFDEQLLIRIRSVCDAHIRLRIEEVGDKLVKVLEVAKVRGADKSTGNIMSFDVEPGIGMRVMPIGRAKA
jgi:flagellar protein FlaH